jgi:hypothetical protein
MPAFQNSRVKKRYPATYEEEALPVRISTTTSAIKPSNANAIAQRIAGLSN